METDLPGIAKQLKALDRAELKAWLRRGELLTQAKALLGDDSSFRTWCRKNGQSKSTAYRAMAAWTNFGTCPDSGRFTKQSMEILAQSEAARNEALQLAATTKITAKLARQLVDRHCDPSRDVLRADLLAEPTHVETRLQVEDTTIVFRSPSKLTTADQIAVLTQALRELTGYNAPSSPPPISPLDRLRSRLAS